eukprot:CAMPEP_0185727228 /NCGR_PEP_ID=MMETSP1171-20130828/2968_1 /TAXON_ID=374046 /ORGANISM="Helicotheca tamensis, Strain CCMP826" /LENGTH=591 /DNA_ID=CAMNT_0028395743 /DNA_START=43 /DNA_END=1818 /DNA_ORIENTATION=+
MGESMPTFDCYALSQCPSFQQSKDEGDFADDATWILTSSFVILTMQTGFGLVEMGSSMAGWEVHILLKNAADVFVGAMSYWLLGYGLSFGTPSSPFMGFGGFDPVAGYDPIESGLRFSQYIFQFSFAATATTIVSGCIAMRLRFFVYIIYCFFAVIFYSFVAHWIWADDGWLNTLGAYDHAGGGPVHLFGGINGLVAIIMVGPRTGMFDGKRTKKSFRAVSPSSQLFGLFMLWWGWIGFNCGSSFGITGLKWVVATRSAISTVNGSAGGGITSIIYSYLRTGRKLIKVDHMVVGILGSLVSTTAACSVINTHESILVGAIGAIVSNLVCSLMKYLHLDDPVGGVGVHVGGGIWGVIAVGIFADASLPGADVRSGLLHGGGMHQLGLQLLETVALTGWSLVTAIPFFYICGIGCSRDWRNPRKGLRMTVEEEMQGADKFLHGLDYFEDYEASEESRTPLSGDHVIDSELGNKDTRGDSAQAESSGNIDLRMSLKRGRRASLLTLPTSASFRISGPDCFEENEASEESRTPLSGDQVIDSELGNKDTRGDSAQDESNGNIDLRVPLNRGRRASLLTLPKSASCRISVSRIEDC